MFLSQSFVNSSRFGRLEELLVLVVGVVDLLHGLQQVHQRLLILAWKMIIYFKLGFERQFCKLSEDPLEKVAELIPQTNGYQSRSIQVEE